MKVSISQPVITFDQKYNKGKIEVPLRNVLSDMLIGWLHCIIPVDFEN